MSSHPEPAIRPADPDDAPAVSALIGPLFREFIAPDYNDRGRAAFKAFIEPGAIAARLREQNRGWIVEAAGQPVGYIERRNAHICLFFVRTDWQGGGLSRRLLAAALTETGPARVTVHASAYAIPIYRRLGFRETGPRQEESGIIFTPMALDVPVLVRIYGRVQGVWFRAWTVETATALGLAGWVRNRADGSVEALFVGAPAAIESMIEKCRQGPMAARVDEVARKSAGVENIEEIRAAGFRQLPSA